MILVIKAQWNESLTQLLTEGAASQLRSQGFEVETWTVPGALEIPLALEWAAQKYSSQLEGVVACGVVIKGETYHFELVANESSRALMDLSLKWRLPVGQAILACHTIEQAEARCQGAHNKGREAAQAVVEMLNLKKSQDLSAF